MNLVNGIAHHGSVVRAANRYLGGHGFDSNQILCLPHHGKMLNISFFTSNSIFYAKPGA